MPTRLGSLSLGDVCTSIVDCNHLTPPSQPAGIPYVRPTDIRNGRIDFDGASKVSEETWKNWTDRIEPTEGDLILVRGSPPIGEVGIVPAGTRVCLGQGTVLLRPNRSRVDSRYLLYLLLTDELRHELAKMAEGTTMVHLNVRDIPRVRLPPLPPLRVQSRIAAILGTLDDKIELNLRTNQTLEQTAQAVFKSWFVDFDPVHAKAEGRWKKGDSWPGMPADMWDMWPSEFEESGIGEIPKGWKALPLDRIANFRNGLALQRFPPRDDSWLPVLKIAQLRAGRTDPDGERASQQIPEECIVNDGDVIFSWSGSLEVRIWCGGRAALNQHLFRVTSEVSPRWFYYFWVRRHLPGFRDIASDKATTMGHIQRSHLSDALVAVPPSGIAERGTQIIEPLLQAAVQASVESRSLSSTRDVLLPKLLSGEIRVPAEDGN